MLSTIGRILCARRSSRARGARARPESFARRFSRYSPGQASLISRRRQRVHLAVPSPQERRKLAGQLGRQALDGAETSICVAGRPIRGFPQGFGGSTGPIRASPEPIGGLAQTHRALAGRCRRLPKAVRVLASTIGASLKPIGDSPKPIAVLPKSIGVSSKPIGARS